MRKELKAALRDRRYVTITRSKGWRRTDGYVVAVDHDWFAVLCLVDARFDGLAVLRVGDVRRVRTCGRQLLAQRVLEHHGMWPPAAPELLDLHDARSVAFSSGSLSRVLSFSEERRKPGAFWVGNTHRITKKWIQGWEIGPTGRWTGQRDIKLGQLTRVVLWDPYVEALTAIADAHERSVP